MIETLTRIWKISQKQHKQLFKALIFSFIRSAFGITQLLAIILTVNVITEKGNIKNCILYIIALTVICIIGNFITTYVEQTSTMQTGFYMTADKRISVGNILQKIPLSFFNDASTGKITATLTTSLTDVEAASGMAIITIISGIFTSFAFLLFSIFYDWRIAIIFGIGVIVYICVVNRQIKVSRKNAPKLQNVQSKLAETTLTFLQGIKVTKAFSFVNGDIKQKKAIEDSCNENISLTDISMPLQFAAHLTIAIFESLIFIAALYFYFVIKDIAITKVIVLMIFSYFVYSSLNQAGSILSMIGLLDSALSNTEKIEKTEQLKTVLPLQTANSNEIVFNNVSVFYGEREVLHNISTTIKEKSLTAIIGPSGAGKTTLCQLIPRFRDVSGGTVTIGGADIRHIEYDELMKKISIVFQNVYLFEDTILNNIRFGKPNASLEEVRAAAKAARCDEFIMALPNGYDTYITEKGNNLSGGEKQRISIARAILKNSPIIILDEATSALDSENEHEILSAIDELTKNKTVIMIAHRIKSVKRADHIIAIKDGKIVEEGAHTELIKRKGLYTDFFYARQRASEWKLLN